MSIERKIIPDDALLEFGKEVGKLKRLPRAGWVANNVANPETVAEHSFRLAVLAMVLAPQFGADQLKAMKMALVHDIGEAEIGDVIVTYGDQILEDHSNKISNEKAAFANIFSLIEGDEYTALFDEFEAQQTPEAKLVKQLDKIEMSMQALEYEEEQPVHLDPFFLNVRNALIEGDLKSLAEHIESQRESE